MANVLVTGGAGFIGSHVADALIARGHSVVVLDDLSGGAAENVPPAAQFVRGSITDVDLLANLFEQHKFDAVFHLAAYAAEALSHFIRRFNYENNVIGSVNLINLAVNHGTKHFVFVSSLAVYGHNRVPMTEATPPRPEDPYGIAKYAVELDLRAAQEQFGLDYTIFRAHNVYGERQNAGDRYRNVIGIFMRQLLRGEPLTIFGDGAQTRAFTHVADVAPCIAAALDVPAARNDIFNVGADEPVTIIELARIIARTLGVEPQFDFQPARYEVAHVWASHDKAQRTFGMTPKISLEEGIRRMVAWVRLAGVRESPKFSAIEIPRGLPPLWNK